MSTKYYDLDDLKCDINYRWIQPPQAAYFVVTVDSYGNENITPVTLGTCVGANLPRGDKPSEYFFTFSLGCVDIPDEGNKLSKRHGFLNLEEVPECVISYIGKDLLEQSTYAGLPVPRGISEISTSGLTPLQSKKVLPPGIAECPVNMEAKVILKHKLGTYYMHYICRIVGVQVQEEWVRRDHDLNEGIGILGIDPLFEVSIRKGNTDNIRLYYGQIDRTSIQRTSDEIGCSQDWIGDFDKWMKDEAVRGKISSEEAEKALHLNEEWQKNRNPSENGKIKEELTNLIKDIIQRK